MCVNVKLLRSHANMADRCWAMSSTDIFSPTYGAAVCKTKIEKKRGGYKVDIFSKELRVCRSAYFKYE